VDHDLIMEGAEEHAVPGAGRAAVGLVLDVVDSARRGGLIAPAGPPAVAVAQDHGVADPGRDGLEVADVQRQTGTAQPDAHLAAAQEAGQPARTREEVHCLADDRTLDGFPGPRGIRGAGVVLAAPAVAAGVLSAGVVLAGASNGGWQRSRSRSTHSRTRSSSATDWLKDRQDALEAGLARRHLAPAANPANHQRPDPGPEPAGGLDTAAGRLRVDHRAARPRHPQADGRRRPAPAQPLRPARYGRDHLARLPRRAADRLPQPF
jgi:hypothetical protein